MPSTKLPADGTFGLAIKSCTLQGKDSLLFILEGLAISDTTPPFGIVAQFNFGGVSVQGS